jgi:hypothetical protein
VFIITTMIIVALAAATIMFPRLVLIIGAVALGSLP